VGSDSALLQGNNASQNEMDGISLQQLALAAILDNSALYNGQGLFIQSSSHLTVNGNVLSENNRSGLRMSGSHICNITENNISANDIAGINLVDCSGNLIYHNLLADNGMQNAADNGQNQWDGGSNEGGNYWSDIMVDGNPSNVPRQIAGGGVDRYPFALPWGWR